MSLIPITTTPPKPEAQRIADMLLHKVNASLAERVHEHCANYSAFWDSAETPDSILAAMGTNAELFLMSAKENIEHIAHLAALVEKQAIDFIAPTNFIPRRAFIIAQDGSATLAPPADGFDANIELTMQRFEANSELGAAVNLQLEKTDVATRVIVNMPEGYVFENGAFAYVAPKLESEA